LFSFSRASRWSFLRLFLDNSQSLLSLSSGSGSIRCLDLEVHFVDLGLEDVLSDVPLHLEGAGEDTVLGGEELVRQHELSRLLERAQLVTNSEIRQLGTDDFLELSGLAQLLE